MNWNKIVRKHVFDKPAAIVVGGTRRNLLNRQITISQRYKLEYQAEFSMKHLQGWVDCYPPTTLASCRQPAHDPSEKITATPGWTAQVSVLGSGMVGSARERR